MRHAWHPNSDDPRTNSDPVAAFLPFNRPRTNYVVPQQQYASGADRAGPSEFGLGKRVERFSVNRFEPDCSFNRDFSHQFGGFSDSEEPHFFHARVCR